MSKLQTPYEGRSVGSPGTAKLILKLNGNQVQVYDPTSNDVVAQFNIAQTITLRSPVYQYDGDIIRIPQTFALVGVQEGIVVDVAPILDRLPTPVEQSSGIDGMTLNRFSVSARLFSALVPPIADEGNQLTTASQVRTMVRDQAARFQGSYDNWTSLPTNEETEDGEGNQVINSPYPMGTPTNNDYIVINDASTVPFPTVTSPTGPWLMYYAGEWAIDGNNGWGLAFPIGNGVGTPIEVDQNFLTKLEVFNRSYGRVDVGFGDGVPAAHLIPGIDSDPNAVEGRVLTLQRKFAYAAGSGAPIYKLVPVWADPPSGVQLVHNDTLLGNGTAADPLRVNLSAIGIDGAMQTFPVLGSDESYTLEAGSGPNYWRGYFSVLSPTIDLSTDCKLEILVDAMSAARQCAAAVFRQTETGRLEPVAVSAPLVQIDPATYGLVGIQMYPVDSDHTLISAVGRYYIGIFTQGYNNLTVAGKTVPNLLNINPAQFSSFQHQNCGNWSTNQADMITQLRVMCQSIGDDSHPLGTDAVQHAFWAKLSGRSGG